jgi:ketosteroid isomerase-like protein
MSEEKFEVVRSFFEAYLAGEPSSAEPFMDAQFEFVPARTSHMTGPAHGGKKFNRAFTDLTNQFERHEVVPQKLIDAGDDRVVVSLHRIAKATGFRSRTGWRWLIPRAPSG